MIKNIIWDFDGVIFDGMKIKADGFVEIFKDFDKKDVKKFLDYHYQNGGTPRFDKIRYFFNHILGQEISQEEILKYANSFAKAIQKMLFNKDNLIQETLLFIQNNHKKYNFFIASGAEENELRKLCDFFEISKYFVAIFGSPTRKDVIVKNILKDFHCKKNESILIGDSINDCIAAQNNDISFFGYNNKSLQKECKNYIESFLQWRY